MNPWLIEHWQRLTGGLDFAWPWLLLALPLPLLLRWLLPPVAARRAALQVPYGDALRRVAAGPAPGRPGGIGPWPWIAWALLCLAAARPQQLGELQQPPQAGRDLMIAIDLSGSMEERDMLLDGRRTDRLTVAKAVIADFLQRRSGDRVGLIVFGSRAYALTPLTRDLASVAEQLQASVVGLPGRATAIGDAIALASKRLQERPDGQRVLILLTDGVNTEGSLDPLRAAELARATGVRVHTIALGGTEPQPQTFFGIQVTPTRMAFDEQTLQKVAELTGGRSFVARDTDQLAGIYAEIETLEPLKFAGERVRPRIERYLWPLLAALACLLPMWVAPWLMPLLRERGP